MADDMLGAVLEGLRDSRRPTFELALEVIDNSFAQMKIDVEKISDGPETWIWADQMMQAVGMPKFYVLTRSLTPGIEGYPLLTVRQAYGLRLDTWVTMSSLVVGPSEDGIVHTISLLIAQHAAAVAGVRFSAKASAQANGNPMVGLGAARYLMETNPPSADELMEEPFDEGGTLVNQIKDVTEVN